MNVDHPVPNGYTGCMTTYQKAEDRRTQILETACQMAEESHFSKIKLRELAVNCETVHGNVLRVMGSMSQLQTDLINYAIEQERHVVIAQAIMDKHPAVDGWSVEARQAALLAAV